MPDFIRDDGSCREDGNTENTSIFDEYFVPIPVKCLGSLIDANQFGERLRPSGDTILNGIKNDFFENYNLNSNIDIYWANPQSITGFKRNEMRNMGMSTAPIEEISHPGYYSILQHESKNYFENHRGSRRLKHILIGYSQGGLVCRYLAFLDEFVFGAPENTGFDDSEGIIHGIITISSPNFGSPLANPENKERIGENALAGIISPLVNLNLTKTPFNDLDSKNLSMNRMAGVIDGIINQLQKNLDNPGTRNSMNFLFSVRKWISGLVQFPQYPKTAFFDLDIKRMIPGSTNFSEFSPLSLINNNNYELNNTYHAAVLGSNNKSFKSIRSLLGIPGVFLFKFKKSSNENPAKQFAIFDTIFNEKIMIESGETIEIARSFPSTRSAIEGYEKGFHCIDKSVKKESHDYVIPTSYQRIYTIEPTSNSKYLGCYHNPDANHLSGSSDTYSAGRTNKKLIKKILKRMIV